MASNLRDPAVLEDDQGCTRSRCSGTQHIDSVSVPECATSTGRRRKAHLTQAGAAIHDA